jgi:hypothetical protein
MLGSCGISTTNVFHYLTINAFVIFKRSAPFFSILVFQFIIPMSLHSMALYNMPPLFTVMAVLWISMQPNVANHDLLIQAITLV